MIELLAPAGNIESFYVAVNNGANAVYLGLKDFSARKNADNFSDEELITALDYAKVMGVKVYCALNTLVKQSELQDFFGAIVKACSLGVDAIILQDIFLGKLIKKEIPDLELHLSTQAGINNVEGALIAKEYGFSRVILARETPIAEIKKITKIIETEVFIQGALCTSFSGHCYMSGYAGGNSGNRGLCKQPCRRTYSLNGANENYPICLADLSLGERINELIDAGVTSFKIEGRMRRAEYVGASVRYYRGIIYPNEKVDGDFSALKRTYNRGDYTEGLAFKQDKKFISSKIQGHIGESVGRIKKVLGNRILVNSNHKAVKGDCFKIIANGLEVGSAECVAPQKAGLTELVYKGKAEVGNEVRITTDVTLNKELLSAVGVRILDVEFSVAEGCKAYAKAFADGILVAESVSESAFPKATGTPLTESAVKEIFNKVAGYPFAVDNFSITIDGAPFGVRSVMNSLRRDLYDRAYKKLSERKVIDVGSIEIQSSASLKTNKAVAVIAEDFSFAKGNAPDICIFAPSDYNDKSSFERFFEFTQGAEKYLYIPSLLCTEDISIISKRIAGFDGIYSENPAGISFAKQLGVKLFIGVDFNLFNGLSASVASSEADRYALSKELTEREIYQSGHGNSAFVFTRGDIKVMELGYCPYGKNCSQCKAKNIGELCDYAGRKFPLRRIKLSRCYFEVYNCAELIYDDFNLSIYNFVLHGENDARARYRASVKEYRNLAETTAGHLKNKVE